MPDLVSSVPTQQGSGLTAALGELAGLLLATRSFDELMQRTANLAVRSIPGAVTSGITLCQGGRVITAAAADPLGSQLDEQQYSLDEGPCLQAMDTAQVVHVTDLSEESRWGSYPQRAMALGVSAVYASPLLIQGEVFGAFNLYADQPHAFDHADTRASIAQMTALTGFAITGALRNYGDVELTQQLQTALNSRSVIDQALGIMMASQRCTADQALTILRGASQTRNIRLADIAQNLVDRTGSS